MRDMLQRQAYLDNELTAEDMRAFESELSPDGLIVLKQEKAFEEALSRRLLSGPSCPDRLWDGLKQKLQPKDASEQVEPTATTFLYPRIMGLAAAILFNFILLGVIVSKHKAERVTIEGLTFNSDIGQFAQSAQIRGGYDVLQESLNKHGFSDIILAREQKSHHTNQILGISYKKLAGKEYAQVYINCCGKPVIALLTTDEGVQVKNLPPGTVKDCHVHSRRVGQHRVIIASPHSVQSVSNLFAQAR